MRRRHRRRGANAGILAAALLASAPVHAQATDPAAAADLFHEGRAAMADGRYAEACAKFEESERLEPKVGTLLNLALCEEARGRVATASQFWEQARDLARASGDARVEYASEHLQAIAPRVPHLTIRLAATAPPGTVVRRDDVELGAASLDVQLPVDPGTYSVRAVSPGHADGAMTVVSLAEGESRETVVEPGALLPHVVPPPVAVSTRPPETPDAPPRALRVVALATGAAGVLSAGVGAYLGIQAMNGRSGAPGTCSGDVCDDTGAAVRRTAIQNADASTVAFAVGGALVATGVVLWILAPSSAPARSTVGLAPGVGPGGGGASVIGSF
ncbi:MAG TPA: hypothetical protein VMI75_12365 [Polyangiaceae bacterium]|nr:hypothetical protein [Polyangiaceae bacterium]